MKIEIYIATHKAYDFPKVEGYIPIHVGKALTDLDLGILGENTGDNISELNPNFCELTALYWMWKNSDADILGLVHYRRYFYNNGKIVDLNMIKKLEKNDLIIARKEKYVKKIKFKFKILEKIIKDYFTVSEQYADYHFKKDWKEVGRVIADKFPDYLDSFNEISDSKNGISHYNMFIAHSNFVNSYCKWLFDILFSLRLNIEDYDQYQKRVFGFISERLLNVYINKHKEYNQIECKVVFLE